MPVKPAFQRFFTLTILLIMIGLAACSAAPSATPGVPTPGQAITQTEPVPTPTLEPAAVWLVAGPEVNVMERDEIAAWLTDQSNQAGLTFSVHESFNQSEIPATLKAVVFLSKPNDAAGLAANLPQTQFVVITGDEISPTTNLSVLRTADNQAVFLAGYLATLNAPDFRSGALLVENDPRTAQFQDAFLNGGRYFCGRCSPVYVPIVPFPQVGLVPANADAAGWQAAFDTLNQSDLQMLFLPAEGLQADFLAYLGTLDVKVFSNSVPPANDPNVWAASVHMSPLSALQSIWPDILSGIGGKDVSADIVIDNVNSANLSQGRVDLAERLIPDLTSGKISPLTLP